MSIKAILEIISGIVALLRSWTQWFHDAEVKQSGRDEVKAEAAEIQAERLDQGRHIEAEAERDHRAKPNDDSAFDQEMFRD